MILASHHQIQKPTKTQGLPAKARITPCAPGGPLCLMNKFATNPSKYVEVQRGGIWQQNGYGVRSVSPRWAISDIPAMNGSVGLAAQSQELSLESFKASKAPIEVEFSHNLCSRYLTHTHLGMMYMLSEVQEVGNTPLESHSCADLSHSRSLSHTHTLSLFLTRPVILVKTRLFNA